LIICYICCSS